MKEWTEVFFLIKKSTAVSGSSGGDMSGIWLNICTNILSRNVQSKRDYLRYFIK